jgi:hypothetical protein
MKAEIEGVDLTISKLEYFAGEALRGLLANPNPNIKSEMVAEMAMVYAEEMMYELKKLDKNAELLSRLYGNKPVQK